jgi:hypothetical protein
MFFANLQKFSRIAILMEGFYEINAFPGTITH